MTIDLEIAGVRFKLYVQQGTILPRPIVESNGQLRPTIHGQLIIYPMNLA